jgi:hypothetical protein
MYSVEVRPEVRSETEIGAAIARWRQWPHSSLSHHDEACCAVAREWVLAMDHAELHGGPALTGPGWLRRKHEWGPSSWPIHWCEAVERETLDCGALAALTHEIYRSRGARSFPTQLIQRYSAQNTDHWERRWREASTPVQWIDGSLIYHEACAVVLCGEEIGIWDPSACSWVRPDADDGYATTRALRVLTPDGGAPERFTWGSHCVVPGAWHTVERAGGNRV